MGTLIHRIDISRYAHLQLLEQEVAETWSAAIQTLPVTLR